MSIDEINKLSDNEVNMFNREENYISTNRILFIIYLHTLYLKFIYILLSIYTYLYR